MIDQSSYLDYTLWIDFLLTVIDLDRSSSSQIQLIIWLKKLVDSSQWALYLKIQMIC